MSHEQRLQRRSKKNVEYISLKVFPDTNRVQHQQMEIHNPISKGITFPFPSPPLNHAISSEETWRNTNPHSSGGSFVLHSSDLAMNCPSRSDSPLQSWYQLLKSGDAPSLKRSLPWPRNSYYYTKAWMLLAMLWECYGMLQESGHYLIEY